MTRVRHATRQWLGGLVEGFPGDLYGVYPLPPVEYVGTLDGDLATAIRLVRESGYAYNVPAATKLHPTDGHTDDGSYRRRDPADPSKQWHVHLFVSPEDPGTVEVFSHYEYAPLWPIDPARSREHYRPDWGSTYLPGRHCERLVALLREEGSYEDDPDAVGPADLPPY